MTVCNIFIVLINSAVWMDRALRNQKNRARVCRPVKFSILTDVKIHFDTLTVYIREFGIRSKFPVKYVFSATSLASIFVFKNETYDDMPRHFSQTIRFEESGYIGEL